LAYIQKVVRKKGDGWYLISEYTTILI